MRWVAYVIVLPMLALISAGIAGLIIHAGWWSLVFVYFVAFLWAVIYLDSNH